MKVRIDLISDLARLADTLVASRARVARVVEIVTLSRDDFPIKFEGAGGAGDCVVESGGAIASPNIVRTKLDEPEVFLQGSNRHVRLGVLPPRISAAVGFCAV